MDTTLERLRRMRHRRRCEDVREAPCCPESLPVEVAGTW